MQRRTFVTSLALAAISPSVFAQSSGGQQDIKTKFVPSVGKGQIEVIEFFSLGCPHCYSHYPLVKAWKEKLPKDVVFKQAPITFRRGAWANLAYLTLILQEMKEFDRLQGDLFAAVHDKKLALWDETVLFPWLVERKVDMVKFKQHSSSKFNWEVIAKKNDKMLEDSGLQGVPSMIVHGRYMLSSMSPQDMLKSADNLVEKIRREMK